MNSNKIFYAFFAMFVLSIIILLTYSNSDSSKQPIQLDSEPSSLEQKSHEIPSSLNKNLIDKPSNQLDSKTTIEKNIEALKEKKQPKTNQASSLKNQTLFYGFNVGDPLSEEDLKSIAQRYYPENTTYSPDMENSTFKYQWSEKGLKIEIFSMDNRTMHTLNLPESGNFQPKNEDNLLMYDSIANKYIKYSASYTWGIDEELVDYDPYINNDPQFNFKDNQLKTCILAKLGLHKSEVPTRDQILSIASLVCSQITNLEGIESWDHLLKINISGPKTLDLTPLKYLKDLEILRLRGELVLDATIFENHEHLLYISFNQTKINNTSALTTIKNLKKVNLEAIEINDYDFLANFIHLNELTIKNIHFDSNTKLVFSNSINSLWLIDVANLSFKNITWPKYIRILRIKNNLTNIDWFPLFNNIKDVNLNGNQIENIKPLFKNKSINSLNLINNNLTQLEGISELSNLWRLKINGNKVKCENTELNYFNKLKCWD